MLLGTHAKIVPTFELVERLECKIQDLDCRRKQAKLKGNLELAKHIAKVIEIHWTLVNKIEGSRKKSAAISYEGW